MVEAAKREEVATKEKGKRKGPLGASAIRILELVTQLVDWKDSTLEPACNYIRARTGLAIDTIWRALKRLADRATSKGSAARKPWRMTAAAARSSRSRLPTAYVSRGAGAIAFACASPGGAFVRPAPRCAGATTRTTKRPAAITREPNGAARPVLGRTRPSPIPSFAPRS